jgi:hypothetical protein
VTAAHRPVRALALLVALCALAAWLADAAVAAADPATIVLREADLPAGTKRLSRKSNDAAQLPGGALGRAYTTTFAYPLGQKRIQVAVVVVTTNAPATARAVHRQLVAEYRASEPTRRVVRMRGLAGDRFAALQGRFAVDEVAGIVIVRTGRVAWTVTVTTDPLAKDYGLSAGEAQRTLETYARKQQRRVGRG